MNKRTGIATMVIFSMMIIALVILAKSRKLINDDQRYECPRNVTVFSTEIYVPAVGEEETSNAKEVERTPTGIVSMQNAGMATTLESISESVVTKCLWDATVELTQSELELLYTTVYCESGDQELEAQIMVAQTILNRILSDKYPNTLRGVVYQRNAEGKPQFAVINWSDFEDRGWTDDTKAAVHYALTYRGYPVDMLYFRDSYYHDFGQPYKNVGDMYFSIEEGQQ